jgi:ABC-2 type transport system ATP-binding protein
MIERSIEVSRLRRTFGSFVAVDDVDFAVERGEIFGYLGANGAGKSTTIRMLCGLLSPSSGKATVAGCDLMHDSVKLRSRIGYMSQRFSLYLDLTVQANIEFFGGAYGLYGKTLGKRRDEILEMTGLSHLRSTTTGDLPGGIRQRLALGTALLHRPQIVFLDEPTAGVDPASRRSFWSLIRELAYGKTTVFVTTHYMDEAEYCARIGLMVAGKLVALDTPEALKTAWVPGKVVAVHDVELEQVRNQLRNHPGVLSVEPFGASVHVRYSPDIIARARLEELLRANAAFAHFESADVTLEDVFLAVVSGRKQNTAEEPVGVQSSAVKENAP